MNPFRVSRVSFLNSFLVSLVVAGLALSFAGCGEKSPDDGDADLGSNNPAQFAIGLSSVSASANMSGALNNPGQTIVVGTKLIVADTGNNRVLIWNSIPTTAMTPADVALGAPSVSALPTDITVSATTLNGPTGVASDGTKLIVVDESNSRALIWNTIPTTSGAAADVVLGQTTMTAGGAQFPSASSISTSAGAALVHGGKLYISDSSNNRVMVWNTIPTANNTAANFAIGQGSLTTASSGSTATTLKSPQQIIVYGTKLLIADKNNCRVLVYNTIPTGFSATADVAIGQSDLTTGTCNGSGTFFSPSGVAVTSGGELYIADQDNHRVVRFAVIPASNGGTPTSIHNQVTVGIKYPNRGGSVAANSMYAPSYVYSSGSNLIVADSSNNRVQYWPTAPTGTTNATTQIGQRDFLTNVANRTNETVSAATLQSPRTVRSDGTRLFVTDTGNNRVLIYSTLPTSNSASASVVLGQNDFTGTAANSGGCTASSLNAPVDVYSDGTRLYVADTGNSRVLVWNSIPTSNGQAADLVLGQTNKTTCVAKAHGADSMINPMGVLVVGSKVLVGDPSFTRIMVWNSLPNSDGAAADYSIGTTSLVGNSSGSDTTKEFYGFSGMASDGTKLYVVDSVGHRVMVWNSIPTTDYVAANAVIGQSSLAVTSDPSSLDLSTLRTPSGISITGDKVYVSDAGANRVLAFTTSSFATATNYVGQLSTSGEGPNAGGISATSLWNPGSSVAIGDKVYIADTNNHRVIVMPFSSWQ